MKRFVCVLCSVGLLLLMALPAFAAVTDTYSLDELHMRIDVPSDMIVVTRDFVSDERALASAGIDLSALRESNADTNVYLNAVADDFSAAYLVIMVADDGTNRTWSFDGLKESGVRNASGLLEQAYAEQGVDAKLDSVYKTDAATYIVVGLQRTERGMTAYGRQYYTIVNGQGISVTMWSYTGPVSQEAAGVQRAMVDSAAYDEIGRPGALMRIATSAFAWGAGGGLAGALVGAVLRVSSRNRARKADLSRCVADAAFRGDTFTHNGKTYDKERYLGYRMLRLDSLKNKEKQLPKLLNQARKKAYSGAPDAALGYMEAEAVQRCMEAQSGVQA